MSCKCVMLTPLRPAPPGPPLEATPKAPDAPRMFPASPLAHSPVLSTASSIATTVRASRLPLTKRQVNITRLRFLNIRRSYNRNLRVLASDSDENKAIIKIRTITKYLKVIFEETCRTILLSQFESQLLSMRIFSLCILSQTGQILTTQHFYDFLEKDLQVVDVMPT